MSCLLYLRHILWCTIFCTVFLLTGDAKKSATLLFLKGFAVEFHLDEWKGEKFCTWRGVICKDDNVWVNLSNSNLRGRIPKLSKGSLDYRDIRVVSVDLSFNPGVYGYIRDSWGQLVSLRYINLSHTSVVGTIPYSWQNLNELVELDVSHSKLTSLPLWFIVGLPSCRRLDFSGNKIFGQLPVSWFQLPTFNVLQELDLRGNSFCGCMPSTWNISSVLEAAVRRANPVLVVPECRTWNSCNILSNYDRSKENNLAFLMILSSALSLEWNGTDYCSWEGVICPEYLQEGISVNLSFRELSGKLPSLENAKTPIFIDSLNLSGNKNIIGTFPPSWGQKLLLLRYVDLSGTSLYGKIPDEWSKIKHLKGIRVSKTMACQGLPEWKGSMLPHLRHVDFSYNNLQGTLQEEWSSLDLQSLNINGNSFCGCIPSSWKRVGLLASAAMKANPRLLHKNCSVSNACGNVNSRCYINDSSENNIYDDTLLFLKALKESFREHLQESWYGSNYCNGMWRGITCNINKGVREVFLNLTGVSLNGTLPEVSPFINGARVTIVSIDLSYNHITGMFPSTWGTLAQLRLINLGFTNIYGPIPRKWKKLRNLEEIYITHTQACLGLPSWDEKSMPKLRHVDFSANGLHGRLSSSWGSFTNLASFRISGNHFCGCIPLTWKSSNLIIAAKLANPDLFEDNCKTINVCRNQNMRCYSNSLTPPTTPDPTLLFLNRISASFGGIVTWNKYNYCNNSGGITCGSTESTDGSSLNLSKMGLIGTLPEFDKIDLASVSLSSIDLSNNIGLTGTLPASWKGLNQLRTLNLDNTLLSSKVPNEWEELKSLESLSISRASLSGSLPIWDGAKMVNIERIDFSYNNFSGVLSDVWYSFARSSLEYFDISGNPNVCVSRTSSWMMSPLLLDTLLNASVNINENCVDIESSNSSQSDGTEHLKPRYISAVIVTVQLIIISMVL